MGYEKYQQIYIIVNVVSLVLAIASVSVSVGIKYTLKAEQLFKKATYTKFVWITFSIVMTYILVMVYAVVELIRFNRFNLFLWIEGARSIS